MIKPSRICFGSGPTVKPLGWNVSVLQNALISRSHRSNDGINCIKKLVCLIRNVLEIPHGHEIAIVPGSATGAVQMLMWNLLGLRTVQILVGDVFSQRWAKDLRENLPHINTQEIHAIPGVAFPLDKINDLDNDILFLWNYSTSGSKIPHSSWIKDDRNGLTICDATSAVYCMDIPWLKLDATAFSWQKGLAGEAGFGVVVLSPKAVAHLDNHKSTQNVPFVMNLRKNGSFHKELFSGLPLNTISMICLEDSIWCHEWALSKGGLRSLIKRSQDNLSLIKSWLYNHNYLSMLASDESIESSSTICFRMKEQYKYGWDFYDMVAKILYEENMGVDLLNHRGSTPAFRVWGGPTMEYIDLEALTKCIDYALDIAYGMFVRKSVSI